MKKVISLILVVFMIITAVPMSAFAAKECLGVYDTHDYGAYVTTTPATCKTEGVATATCKRVLCNATTTKTLPVDATNHTEFAMPAKDPTCTVSGNTAGVVCSACDVVIRGYAVIPAKGHNYQTEWQTIVAPTCTEAGVAIKICKNCFEIQTNTLPVVEHIDSNADYKCDICTFDMTPPQPEQPQDPTENCSCNCHKEGIAKFFFNFILFFQKLFKKNQICEGCGAYHY